MGRTLHSFDDLGDGLRTSLAEEEVARACELLGDPQEAAGILRAHNLRNLKPELRRKCGRVYHELSKRQILEGDHPGARDSLNRARECGLSGWPVARKSELVNAKIADRQTDPRIAEWVSRLSGFVRPPRTKVRVFDVDDVFCLTIYRWRGDKESHDELSRLIRALKKEDGGGVCDVLACLLLEGIKANKPNLLLADCLLSVPPDPERFAERRFDNVDALARMFERRSMIPLARNVLTKTRSTVDLRNLQRSERRAALRGAFSVEPKRREKIEGLRVAVVDDVLTSGATLDACAEELKAAGAAEVYGCTVARSESSK